MKKFFLLSLLIQTAFASDLYKVNNDQGDRKSAQQENIESFEKKDLLAILNADDENGKLTNYLNNEHNPNLFDTDQNKTSLLQYCITNNKQNYIIKLLTGRPKVAVNYKNQAGDTALHMAAYNKNTITLQHILRYIYENFHNSTSEIINEINNNGFTPLDIAVINGDLESAKELIKNGAQVNNPNAQYSTLHYACGIGSAALIKLLIENGADISQKTNNKKVAAATPLDIYKNTMYKKGTPEDNSVTQLLSMTKATADANLKTNTSESDATNQNPEELNKPKSKQSVTMVMNGKGEQSVYVNGEQVDPKAAYVSKDGARYLPESTGSMTIVSDENGTRRFIDGVEIKGGPMVIGELKGDITITRKKKVKPVDPDA